MSETFQKRKEDFVCENCGQTNEGNGFTNHCSSCLWSKHVDVNPGDRRAPCQGMMEPISVELKAGEYILTHKCIRCGFLRKNKAQITDDFSELVKISQRVLQ